MMAIVVVSGNLCVGKTTLINGLKEIALDWSVVNEPVEANPYLCDYYEDKARWAVHLQAFFLGQRAIDYHRVQEQKNIVLMDRSVYDDGFVFVPALRRLGILDKRDEISLARLHSAIIKPLQQPKMILYLKASVDAISRRIRGRNLYNNDKTLSRDYLKMISQCYDEWLVGQEMCEVITLDTELTDYRNQAALIELAERILAKCGHGI